MRLRKLLYELKTEATTGQIFKPTRGKPVKFNPRKHPEIAPEIFDMIQTAYASIGGHAEIKTPSDVMTNTEWTYWEGIDIHNDPDFDIVFFGQHTKYGLKFSGIGHDGTSDAKRAYLQNRAAALKKSGYYIEVSDKLAQILINKYGVPIVDDQDTVEEVLGKKVKWLGNIPGDDSYGWYERSIGGDPHAKILVGRPKVKTGK